jgi:hypothetical protein
VNASSPFLVGCPDGTAGAFRFAANELREEPVGSDLYHVQLEHELEPNDYDRSCQTTMHI